MRPPRPRSMLVMSLAMPVLLASCVLASCKGPQATSPEGAARAFVRAVASGNGKKIFGLLTPATQKQLTKAAQLASAQAGSRQRVKPHELLAASLAKPKYKLFSVKVVEEKGDRARVKLSDADEKHSETWSMVKVAGTWRIELPHNAMPPAQRTPPASAPTSAPASQPGSGSGSDSGSGSGSGSGSAVAPPK